MNESTQITNKKLLEPALSYKIQGIFYNVAIKYGSGLKEQIYQKALAEELTKNKVSFEEQKRINIYSVDSGKLLGVYVPDFVINGVILLELKSKPFITKEDERQFWLYLKASDYKVGLLVNFGPQKLEIRRRVYDKARKYPHKSA